MSERTVKFHVSSLLAKFGVASRVALSREVALDHMPTTGMAAQAPPDPSFGYPVGDREREDREIRAIDPPPPVAKVPRGHAPVFWMFPKQRFAT
jgi:hypothetical protein